MDLEPDDEREPVAALGTVVEQDRGSLPYALIHGEALVACAAWALGEAGVTAVDLGTDWSSVVESGEPFVLHDPLCPMTPASFVRACVEQAAEHDVVVVGVDDAGSVTSPLVLPAPVVASLDGVPGTDLAEVVALLRERAAVETVVAPAEGRRVGSVDEVRALEADTRPPGAR